MDMVKKGVPAIVLAGVLLLALLGAVPASAEMPWWQLNSSSVPRNMQPAVNQVDELRVTATGGIMLLDIKTPTSEVNSGPVPYNAEASTVQAALEKVLGAGTVAVSGGPGD